MTGKRIPASLFLVDRISNENKLRTILIGDNEGHLVVEITKDNKRSRVILNDIQAQRISGRIRKFLRENR